MNEYIDISIAFAYAIIIGIFLWKLRLVKRLGFPIYAIPLLFAVKCVLALVYTKMHLVLYNGGDTFQYFKDGNIVFETIKENPLKYLYLTYGPNSTTNEFPAFVKQEILEMGFWGDTSAYMMVRFNAFIRLVSFGSFYTHSIFMSLISTLGLVWLYKAVCNEPKNKATWLFFAMPFVLFWTSGVHKEAFLIFTLGGFFFALAKLYDSFSLKQLVLLVVFAFSTFLIRDFIFYLIIPGWFAYWLSQKIRFRPIVVYTAIYFSLMTVGLWIPISNSGNYINMITQKHQEFHLLNYGNSKIDSPDFEDNLMSIIAVTPKAFANALFGPFLLKQNSAKTWILKSDTIAILLLWLILIIVSFKQSGFKPLFSSTVWLLAFGISLLVIIGLIVPNVGAIVRYRSIALVMITLALVNQLTNNNVFPLKKTI